MSNLLYIVESIEWIIFYEYTGFGFELNIELNHLARFNEKMNIQNVSARASWGWKADA